MGIAKADREEERSPPCREGGDAPAKEGSSSREDPKRRQESSKPLDSEQRVRTSRVLLPSWRIKKEKDLVNSPRSRVAERGEGARQ